MAFRALTIIGIVGFSFSAAVASTNAMEVQDGDQLLVTGVNAQVNFVSIPGSRQLSLRGATENGWHLERRDHLLVIEGPQGDSRKAVLDQLKAPGPREIIDLQGPSMPIEIHLREGTVFLNKGQHEARVDLKNGHLTSTGRSGLLKASVLKGDVVVSDGTGPIDLDVYQGSISLKNLQVEGDIQVFGGSISVDQSRGRLSLNTNQALSKIQKFSGTLILENGKGTVTGNGLQGRIEGSSAEGAVHLQIVGETEVHLKTQTARVQIQLPPTSGALLSLTTNEGDIAVPSELKVNRGALEKTVRGRVKGEAGKVSVTVRSQEGSIVVK